MRAAVLFNGVILVRAGSWYVLDLGTGFPEWSCVVRKPCNQYKHKDGLEMPGNPRSLKVE